MAKEPEPAQEIPPQTEEKPKRSSRLIVLLCLVSLILFQVTLMFFLLPGPKQVADEVKGSIVLTPPPEFEAPVNVAPNADLKSAELIEKELGDKFQIQDLRPNGAGETDLFSVKVTLRVDKKDEVKYDKLYEQRKNTIRGLVTAVLRASTLDERRQETLTTIRQKIQNKINDELGSNYVKDVVCTDISVGTM